MSEESEQFTTTVERHHDFCAGHRVFGHESKCAHLHGHNYRVHFTLRSLGGLDEVGRVIDFSVIKSQLCQWIEDNWDHRFLVFEGDHHRHLLAAIDPDGVVIVPFNPTAENMARHLLLTVAPAQLIGRGVELISVRIQETSKCSATFSRSSSDE